MRNFKKIITLIIVFTMALSVVSFADYTDVKEDASYYEAVNVLSALNLLKGYDDGAFSPDKTITRAEFAAVVVRMLGMEDAAAGAATATGYKDVPNTHWAAGYVKIASQKGIIAGYGKGKFGPEDEVTYEQAVKMLVCALGYAPMFELVNDAYPTAYMSQANTLGMTVGAPGKIGDKATRATVARLVFNALDDKIMEQISFGKEKEYGIPTLYETPLSRYLKVAKVDATVSPVGFSSEDSTRVYLSDITYDGRNSGMYGGEYRDVVISDGEYDIVEGINIPKGYAVTAYVHYNDDGMTVLAVMPKTGKNDVLELKASQMEEGILNFSSDSLEYYKISAAESSRREKVKLDNDIDIYVNQNTDEERLSSYTQIANDYASGNITSLKLINNDKDSAYDVMLISRLVSGVVEDIYYANESLSTSDGYTYEFDKDVDDMTYTLKDVRGHELKFSDIKKGDVINVYESEDSRGNNFYEYIISSDKVEGKVTEKSADLTKVYINGKEYKIGNTSVEAGDKGIFYVDITGRILDKKLDSSSRTFGLLYAVYNDTKGADTEVKATIYTMDGRFVNYTFAKNVSFRTNTVNTTIASKTLTYSAHTLKSGSTSILTTNNAQLVMYSANSSGAINSIVTASKIAAESNYEYTYESYKTGERFDAIDSSIDGVYVTDSTVIIANKEASALLNNNAKENYTVSTKNLFADEEEYNIEYVADVNDELAYIIVYDAKAKTTPDNSVMYVSADPSRGQTADGDTYYIIKGYVNGEFKSFNVDMDTWVEYANGVTPSENYNPSIVTKGAIVQYNGGDISSAVRVIATAQDVADAASGTLASFGVDAKDDETGYLVAGRVDKYSNGNIYFEDGKKVSFKAGTPSVKVTLNGGFVNRVFAGYTIANAETKGNSGVGNNDDVIIVYNFDKENKACVIIDVDNDNRK